MTTWTMDQVRDASRLRATAHVDAELLDRHPQETRESLLQQMGKRLIDMAHPFGIELHPGDFEMTWEQSPDCPWESVAHVRWHPTTNTVELRGGYHDGQRYALADVGAVLRLPRIAVSPWLDHATSSEAAVTQMVDTYELVGWREYERVWVYAATA